jgi:Holliday junction resolvase
MNCKAKGARQELRSKAILEAAGYAVTKAGASLGVFDLIGISPTDIVLVQVKSNAWPRKEEMENITLFRCPGNCRKLLHRWRDRKRLPDVREV